jgi:hypothetical protein
MLCNHQIKGVGSIGSHKCEIKASVMAWLWADSRCAGLVMAAMDLNTTAAFTPLFPSEHYFKTAVTRIIFIITKSHLRNL